MRIVVDAMGGDHAPEAVVAGVVEAIKEFDVHIILVGIEEKVDAELKKYDQILIPDNINYNNVLGLSLEMIEKFSCIKPISIKHAKKISGVTPVAISLLYIYIRKNT